jgi:uncharacterized protein YcfL
MLAEHYIGEDFNMSAKKIVLIAMVMALGHVSVASADNVDSKVVQHGTARYLKVSGLSAKRTNNLLIVHAEVTNKDSGDQQGYYRVSWLDESGDSVWDDEQWKPLLLHGNQKSKLKMVAPTTKASDFKIEFSAKENWRD